ncbi:MAG: domain 2 [Planctomycetota bacterium]
MSEGRDEWFWSQKGSTMGPVPFSEIRRLYAAGSIDHATWIYDPTRGAWVVAGAIPEIAAPEPAPAVGAAPGAPVAPPPDAAERFLYCRFCGSRNTATAARCTSCGRETGVAPPTSSIDPKLAAVVCRACLLAMPALNVFAFIGPAIAWALGSGDPRVVAESKAAINAMLTVSIVFVASLVVGIVGAVVFVGPVLAALVAAALAVYCIVVGIQGLIAAGQNAPFRYPMTLALVK